MRLCSHSTGLTDWPWLGFYPFHFFLLKREFFLCWIGQCWSWCGSRDEALFPMVQRLFVVESFFCTRQCQPSQDMRQSSSNYLDCSCFRSIKRLWSYSITLCPFEYYNRYLFDSSWQARPLLNSRTLSIPIRVPIRRWEKSSLLVLFFRWVKNWYANSVLRIVRKSQATG